MVSQCTKFEVPRFTRYDAMNGGAKCRKWGSLGQLWGTQDHRQCQKLCLYFSFRDIAGYLSKVADFDPPHLHSAPS